MKLIVIAVMICLCGVSIPVFQSLVWPNICYGRVVNKLEKDVNKSHASVFPQKDDLVSWVKMHGYEHELIRLALNENENYDVRFHAIEILDRVGSEQATNGIIDLISKLAPAASKSDEDELLHASAIAAIHFDDLRLGNMNTLLEIGLDENHPNGILAAEVYAYHCDKIDDSNLWDLYNLWHMPGPRQQIMLAYERILGVSFPEGSDNPERYKEFEKFINSSGVDGNSDSSEDSNH